MYVARRHRHSTPPVIDEALSLAIDKVRSDKFENDWVLAGFEGRDNVQLVASGTGGIEALKASLVKWDVSYGLVRTRHTLERAGCVQADLVKFVWIYWRPDSIPVIRKMKIGVHEGQMKQLFAPYHAELHATSLEEIGSSQLGELLDCITMSADKTASRPLPSPARKSAAQVHWARARSLLPAVQLAIAHEHKKVGTNDVKFEDPEAFEAAIKAVRSDVNFADWCLVGYKAEKTLGVIGGGRGGLDALLDAADPSSVNYGILRVSEKFDMVFHEAFCYITWMPEKVPAVVKARISTHQGAVAQAFRMHVHCQFHFRATERGDITMESIRERVRQVIGSKGAAKKAPKSRSSAASRRSRNPSAVSKAPSIQSPVSNPSTGKVKATVNKTLRPPATPQRKRYITSRSPTRVVRAPTAIPASSSSSSSSSFHGPPARPARVVSDVKTEVKPSVSPLAQPKNARPVIALSEPKIHLPGPFMTLDTKGHLLEEKMKDAPVALKEAVEKVKKGGEEADFVVVGWRHGAAAEGGKGEQLELKEIGKGGVQALAECLQAHSVLYGLVRVTESVGNAEKEKFCCVRWAPEAVPVTTKRSEIGSFQGEVSKLFQPYHGDLTASDPSHVTPEAVAARVRKFRLKQ